MNRPWCYCIFPSNTENINIACILFSLIYVLIATTLHLRIFTSSNNNSLLRGSNSSYYSIYTTASIRISLAAKKAGWESVLLAAYPSIPNLSMPGQNWDATDRQTDRGQVGRASILFCNTLWRQLQLCAALVEIPKKQLQQAWEAAGTRSIIKYVWICKSNVHCRFLKNASLSEALKF